MVTHRRPAVGARTTGAGSVVGTFLGLGLVIVGGATLTTVGVVLVILGAVSFLLTLGLYLDETGGRPGRPTDEPGE